MIINDISALRFDPEMAPLAAEYGTPVVLMHMKGIHAHNGSRHVTYDSLMPEIFSFLKERIAYAESTGIDSAKIIVDPGIGFGKSIPDGNLKIIKHLSLLKDLGKPILVGPSRKAFIGSVLELGGRRKREEGTAAAVALAVSHGAHMVRVHDIKKMKRVVKMVDAIIAVE